MEVEDISAGLGTEEQSYSASREAQFEGEILHITALIGGIESMVQRCLELISYWSLLIFIICCYGLRELFFLSLSERRKRFPKKLASIFCREKGMGCQRHC